MMKLYYYPGACSLAGHIVLEWIGEPYEAIEVDIHELPGWYRGINPAGAVPALDTGDGIITQNSAVLNYLAQLRPELELVGGPSAGARADLDRWTAFLTGDLHPAFWPVFTPRRFTTATDDGSLEAVREAGRAQVRARLGLLEARLEGASWIAGGRRTVVDAYATPMLNWATAMLPEALANFPNLFAFRERMLADPGVGRAMAAEGLPVGNEENEHEHA